MVAKFTELHCKEVICVSDGRRLGYVADVCVEIPGGNITAIVVPGPSRCCGLLGPGDDYIIPWCRIVRIGPDIVLVDTNCNFVINKRGKSRAYFFIINH